MKGKGDITHTWHIHGNGNGDENRTRQFTHTWQNLNVHKYIYTNTFTLLPLVYDLVMGWYYCTQHHNTTTDTAHLH